MRVAERIRVSWKALKKDGAEFSVASRGNNEGQNQREVILQVKGRECKHRKGTEIEDVA
jgi:hypothetical protein